MEQVFDEIELKVKEAIKKVLQVKDEEVTKESTIEELGGDSLAALGILSALEQEFDVDILDEEALKIDSFRTAVQVMKKCLSSED